MEKKTVVTGVDRNHQRGATLLSPEDIERSLRNWRPTFKLKWALKGIEKDPKL